MAKSEKFEVARKKIAPLVYLVVVYEGGQYGYRIEKQDPEGEHDPETFPTSLEHASVLVHMSPKE